MTGEMDHGAAVDGLVRKLRARDALSAEEEQVLRDSVSETREVGAGKVIVRAGSDVHESTLLVHGIIARYKDLAGGERQIQELHVDGDFVDLHGFLLKRLDHNIGAVSRCRIAAVPHGTLKRITELYPHLVRMLWFSTVLDAAIQRETILSVGRRSAVARIAHLMCEMCIRLEVGGKATRERFMLPMTQTDIADATGLTPVHVNRMLKQLREQEILTFRNGEVVIHDWSRLAAIAEFNPIYLHLENRPR
ncbi:MAG TPA: Crp/Fnr family transcriptional regulator [Allosphingosinicella sp.]|nr:Crp/Fnr family transcriptional regulator [Allosphingosinicella sp.]